MRVSEKCRRYIVVAVGFSVLVTAGILGGIISMQNDLKKQLSVSQKQVELVLSIANLGFNCGLPCGLILERFGPRWASFSAMITVVCGYLGFYIAAIYPKEFGDSLFWLLVIFSFIAGLGTMHMYTNGVAVNAYNFEAHFRGRVMGFVACGFFVGIGVYSVLYQVAFGSEKMPEFLLLCICMLVVVNLVAMALLKTIPPDDSNTDKNKAENTITDDKSEAYRNKNNEEKDKLIKATAPLKIVYYGEYNICQAMRIADFHLILWPCILGTCVAFVYTYNLPTFLKSFDLSNLETSLMFAGSILAAVTKFGCSLVSDLTLTRLPRVFYMVILLSLETVCMLLSCFIGNEVIIVVIASLSLYIAIAVYMALAPIVISDLFGTKYLASVWGTLALLGGLGCLAMSYLLGALYDLQIEDEGDTCYGLKCFRVMFIISTLLSATSLIMSIAFYKRQMKLLDLDPNSEGLASEVAAIFKSNK